MHPKRGKKQSTDKNTEPMEEWRLAFCIIFCAFFDRKMLQDDSWRILDILRKMRKMVKKIAS